MDGSCLRLLVLGGWIALTLCWGMDCFDIVLFWCGWSVSAKAFCKCQPRAQILGPCRGTQAAWTVAEGLLDQQQLIGKNIGNVTKNHFWGWGREGTIEILPGEAFRHGEKGYLWGGEGRPPGPMTGP